MIVALGLLELVVVGLPVALLIDRRLRGGLLIGVSFLLGSGVIAFTLFLLSILGIDWTLVSLSITVLAILAICFFALRRGWDRGQVTPPRERVGSSLSDRIIAAVTDGVTLLLVVGHGLYATLSPISEWDFWAIWGLKARVFLEEGGIDWQFLESPFNTFSHPDYPILVPLQYVYLNLLQGRWEDRMIGLLSTAFGAAILLIVRNFFGEEFRSRALAALATLALARIALSSWVGIAEGLLIAFIGAGLLFLRRGVLEDDERSFRMGAVMLGLAAFTKNEGLSMVVACLIALVIHYRGRWKSVVRLWPAVAIPLPWIVLRITHSLPTDLASGPLLERVQEKVMNIGEVTGALGRNLPNNLLFWISVLIALALFARNSYARERFVLIAVAIQVLFYFGAYLATPNELNWHVATSWVRLLNQVALPLGFSTIILLAPFLENRTDITPKEAVA